MIETEITGISPYWGGLGGTSNVANLEQRDRWIEIINEKVLKVKEEDPFSITSNPQWDITQSEELLKGIARSYELLESRPPVSKVEKINEEREENLRFYNQHKKELYKKYVGKYVVIAKGEVQAVGESFDDLKNVALDANQRFIFKAEPKKKVRGTLRWPIKK